MLIFVLRLCGSTKSQPSVNSISGYAIVNLTSDVFAIPPQMNVLCPNCMIAQSKYLHFLRDLDELYTIKNVPEFPKLPLAMRAVTDPIAKKKWFGTVYSELNGYERFKKLFTKVLCALLENSVITEMVDVCATDPPRLAGYYYPR